MCIPSNNDIYNFAQININEGGWSETDSNGWRYFKNPISPGESTSLICENVTIKGDADIALIKPFDIYVIAESVQCANYVDAATAFASIGVKNIESDDGVVDESSQENEMQNVSEVSENV